MKGGSNITLALKWAMCQRQCGKTPKFNPESQKMGLPNNVKYSWNVVCNTEGVSEHRVVYPQIAIMGKPGSHMMKQRLTSGPWGWHFKEIHPWHTFQCSFMARYIWNIPLIYGFIWVMDHKTIANLWYPARNYNFWAGWSVDIPNFIAKD